MNQDETIALFIEGKEKWNEWAEGMLAERKRLEEAGEWEIGKGDGWPDGSNIETQTWLDAATADFRGLILNEAHEWRRNKEDEGEPILNPRFKRDLGSMVFPGTVDFRITEFRTEVNFDGTVFHGYADFEGAIFRRISCFIGVRFEDKSYFTDTKFEDEVSFGEAVFADKCVFSGAMFDKYSSFGDARFECSTYFDHARFGSLAAFDHALFAGGASFCLARFEDEAEFARASFSAYALFERVVFQNSANFPVVLFHEGIDFEGCEFAELARWDRAHFASDASFRSVKSRKAFSLRQTVFAEPPDFLEADFHVAPVVDDMTVSLPVAYRVLEVEDGEYAINGGYVGACNCTKTADDHRFMRTLRKLADDGGDHLQSMNFFADEIRARRHWVDLPGGPGMARYYFGWAYQIVSDFGRSVSRPFGWWLGSIAAFAGVYGWLATVKPVDGWAAGYLSARHALVVGGLTRSGKLNEVLGRLFGDGEGVMKVPDGAGFVMLAQPVVSAVFLFFMALALRNHFKIGR